MTFNVQVSNQDVAYSVSASEVGILLLTSGRYCEQVWTEGHSFACRVQRRACLLLDSERVKVACLFVKLFGS
jgi:hypothetical protein